MAKGYKTQKEAEKATIEEIEEHYEERQILND